MTTQDQIDALLAEAAPLRAMSEDDPRREALPGLVDRINGLRVQQQVEALHRGLDNPSPLDQASASYQLQSIERTSQLAEQKRGPCRPRKTEA